MKILFVCTGNTCRSPMAEALLKDMNKDLEVKSAGVFAIPDQSASEHTVSVLAERGIDIDHQAQPVSEELLTWADLVLTMTRQHKQSLIMNYPHLQDKFFTLKEYVLNVDNNVSEQFTKISENDEGLETINKTQSEQGQFSDLQDETEEPYQLESSLLNDDISDPFGGDLEVYRNTLKEMEEYIVLLNKKIMK